MNDLKRIFYYGDVLDNEKDKTEFLEECNKNIEKIRVEFKDKVENLQKLLFNNDKNQPPLFELFTQFVSRLSSEKIDDKLYNRRYKPIIHAFIEMIDKNNAVSAIGTVEFLDKIAKYNTVQTICKTNNILSVKEVEDYEKENKIEEIYSSFGKGGSYKKTKRNHSKVLGVSNHTRRKRKSNTKI
jgi:hypothetical protein